MTIDDSKVQPLTISARNCEAMIGMSWAWVKRFCAANGVPIYRVGERKQLVPAKELLAAIERVGRESAPDEDGLAELEAMRDRVRNAGRGKPKP